MDEIFSIAFKRGVFDRYDDSQFITILRDNLIVRRIRNDLIQRVLSSGSDLTFGIIPKLPHAVYVLQVQLKVLPHMKDHMIND